MFITVTVLIQLGNKTVSNRLLVLVLSTLAFSSFVMHDKNDINSLVVDSFDMDFNTQD